MGFLVALHPLLGLLFEPGLLLGRIGQLGEGVGQLHAGDHQLEAGRFLGRSGGRLGQGRDVLGRIDDKRRLDEGLLHPLVEDDVQGPPVSQRLLLRGQALGVGDDPGPVVEGLGRQAAALGQGLAEPEPAERPLQGDDLIAVGKLVLAQEVGAEAAENLLGQVHHVVIVPVSFVELEHRELGIVLGVDPLVAEIAVDLVNLFHPADDQALEIELRGHPKVQVEVEGVMVGDERPGQGPAGQRLHHRRLDLDVAAAVEKLPEPGDDRAPEAENLSHLGIHDQVEIAPPLADLGVLEAVPFLRQRVKTLGQKNVR